MKKFTILLLSTVCFLSFLSAQITFQPMTVLAENATATWCGYCPDAYAGLDVVHDTYRWDEFASIRYYATSGDYGTPETQARIDYYEVTGYPTTVFQGMDKIVGGSATIATGTPFLNIVEKYYFAPSPILVEITDFDNTNGAVSVTVTMFDPEFEIDNADLVLVLVEEDVTTSYTHVTRDVITEAISLSGAGNTFSTDLNFDLSYVSDYDATFAHAFVQMPDQEILNSANTYPIPDYRVRAIVPFEFTAIGPSDQLFEQEFFTIYNNGLDNEFNVSIHLDEGPQGTSLSFCDHGSCYFFDVDISLGENEYYEFHANVMPGGPGMVTYHFEVSSENTELLIIPFTFITDDTDVIVIDDDGGEPFEDYFLQAIAENGKTYGVWDRSKNEVSEIIKDNFDNIFWNVGWNFPSLDAIDRSFLIEYLDAGKNLFLSGQDIGWDLNESDDNQDVAFYHDYLHANYLSDDVNNYDLTGLAGHPYWDGVDLHIAGGDGANNQEYPSKISAYDDAATEIFFYSIGGAGAIEAVHPGSSAKIVYFAFGFEAVDNADDRNLVIGNIIDWFDSGSAADENLITGINQLFQNYPNPFNPTTNIKYALDESSHVTLEIYNLKGEKVKTIVNGLQDPGEYNAIWNGVDENGTSASSGIYFYKINAGRYTSTKKMILMK